MNKRIFDDQFLLDIHNSITICINNGNKLSGDILVNSIKNHHSNIRPYENQLIDIHIDVEFASNFLHAYNQYKLKFVDYRNTIDKSLIYAYNKSLLIN